MEQKNRLTTEARRHGENLCFLSPLCLCGSVVKLFIRSFGIAVSDGGRWEGTVGKPGKKRRTPFAHSGERTPAPQAGFRPDLLPSGLYRRPRSFTGSWGLQALCALSANCAGRLFRPPAQLPGILALVRAFRTTPRGLYRRLGIGKARIHFLPSPCPEGQAFTHQS